MPAPFLFGLPKFALHSISHPPFTHVVVSQSVGSGVPFLCPFMFLQSCDRIVLYAHMFPFLIHFILFRHSAISFATSLCSSIRSSFFSFNLPTTCVFHRLASISLWSALSFLSFASLYIVLNSLNSF